MVEKQSADTPKLLVSGIPPKRQILCGIDELLFFVDMKYFMFVGLICLIRVLRKMTHADSEAALYSYVQGCK